MRATALAAAAAMLSPLVTPMEHGWGCVLGCGGVSMLGGDFSTARFSLDDPWWLDVITASYGVVVVHELPVMAALKRRDPKIKTLLYQPIDRAGDSDLILRQLKAHSDWFVRDDEGRVVNFHGREGRPMPNYTIPDCQDWYANLAISLFPNRSVAALVLGGILLDGDGYHSYPNVSRPRAEALYQGMIQTTRKMQAAITALNGCGEVLINSGMWCDGPDNDTNASGPINQLACRSPVPMIDAASGSFDEMFGSFSTMEGTFGGTDSTGAWDVDKMRISFDTIINSTNAGKMAFIHAFPGPAGATVGSEGMFPLRGNTSVGSVNNFHVAQWAGPERVPASAAACRAAAAERLVESLAPFLIVANERTFFSYAWFYGVQDGYIPCQPGVECGMPAEWYPEFRKPLGPPRGPAETDHSRTVWTRRFEHAKVFVDLRNRSAARIDWG